jgi:hypothetical protein
VRFVATSGEQRRLLRLLGDDPLQPGLLRLKRLQPRGLVFLHQPPRATPRPRRTPSCGEGHCERDTPRTDQARGRAAPSSPAARRIVGPFTVVVESASAQVEGCGLLNPSLPGLIDPELGSDTGGSSLIRTALPRRRSGAGRSSTKPRSGCRGCRLARPARPTWFVLTSGWGSPRSEDARRAGRPPTRGQSP